MFDRVKRLFGNKPASAPTVAWEKPNSSSSSASGRAPPPLPPSLASSRNQAPSVATRSHSGAIMGAPSAESVMAAKRQQTATAAPAKIYPAQSPIAAQRENSAANASGSPSLASDNRRVVKSTRKGERTDAKDFMNIATAGGERNLRQAKAREVQLKTRHGMEDGITLRHRSGSVTELQLSNADSSVAAAKHHSKTTGQTFEVRENKMRGPAKRQLDKIVKRNDHRSHE